LTTGRGRVGIKEEMKGKKKSDTTEDNKLLWYTGGPVGRKQMTQGE